MRQGAGIVVVVLVGGVIGLQLGGAVRTDVGPVDARLSVRLNPTGDSRVDVAPLGTIDVDSHDGPLRLVISVTQLRPDAARRAFSNPASLRGLGDRVAADLRHAVIRLAVKALVVGMLGAAILGLLFFRRIRLAALCGALAGGALAVFGGVAVLTWRPQALAEPHYTGLLTNAPALVGSARDIVDRFDRYSSELAGLVSDVSRLYDVTSTLSAYRPDASTVRLLHVSDLHLNPAAWDVVRSVIKQYKVDAVIDTGDMTDHGSRPENRFVAPIGRLGVPYVYVRGNHDSLVTESAVRRQAGAIVLDGSAASVAGLRIWGLGDPRFTPDKTTRDDAVGDEALMRVGLGASDRLAAAKPVDIAITHDPVVAEQFAGLAPLLLAGHSHQRRVKQLPGSLLLVAGSTGGAGLRGLEGERPTPLECSVLYVDRTTRRPLAYDDLTLGGLGLTSATVQRHVVRPGTPTPSPTAVP